LSVQYFFINQSFKILIFVNMQDICKNRKKLIVLSDNKFVKILKISCIFLFFNFYINNLFSQNSEIIKNSNSINAYYEAEKNIKTGNKYYVQSKPILLSKALEYYLKALEFNNNNSSLNFKTGYCYLFGSQKSKSINYLLKSYKTDSVVDEKIEYYIGLSYQHNFQFDSAKIFFNKYFDKLSSENKIRNKKLIEKRLSECSNAKELLNKSKKYYIENLGITINTPYNDYAPIVFKDENSLIFTSTNPNSTGGNLNPDNDQYFEDIYITNKINNLWTKPVSINCLINTNSHEAATGISKDKNKLLIYKGLTNGGDLFQSFYVNNSWSLPMPLPATINTPSQESSACFSPQNKFLFFTSNRADLSLGEHDIFISKSDEKGNWETSSNIGETVNTREDEEGVFLSNDGKNLYFSSKGHNSMGGFDIFKSTLQENGEWTQPENLGYPINSVDDDICVYIIGNNDSIRGYFSSNRDGGFGGYDIYRFSFQPDSLISLNKTTNDTLPDLNQNQISNNISEVQDSNIVIIVDTINNNLSKKDTIQTKQIVSNNLNNKTDSINSTKKISNIKKPKLKGESSAELLAKGIDVDSVKGIFYTVQIGAYIKPLTNDAYFGLTDIFFEHLDNGFMRLLTGKFDSFKDAVVLRNKIIASKHEAFIRAYCDGKAISTELAAKMKNQEKKK